MGCASSLGTGTVLVPGSIEEIQRPRKPLAALSANRPSLAVNKNRIYAPANCFTQSLQEVLLGAPRIDGGRTMGRLSHGILNHAFGTLRPPRCRKSVVKRRATGKELDTHRTEAPMSYPLIDTVLEEASLGADLSRNRLLHAAAARRLLHWRDPAPQYEISLLQGTFILLGQPPEAPLELVKRFITQVCPAHTPTEAFRCVASGSNQFRVTTASPLAARVLIGVAEKAVTALDALCGTVLNMSSTSDDIATACDDMGRYAAAFPHIRTATGNTLFIDAVEAVSRQAQRMAACGSALWRGAPPTRAPPESAAGLLSVTCPSISHRAIRLVRFLCRIGGRWGMAANTSGQTALHAACRYLCPEVLAELLRLADAFPAHWAGAPALANARDVRGCTALHVLFQRAIHARARGQFALLRRCAECVGILCDPRLGTLAAISPYTGLPLQHLSLVAFPTLMDAASEHHGHVLAAIAALLGGGEAAANAEGSARRDIDAALRVLTSSQWGMGILDGLSLAVCACPRTGRVIPNAAGEWALSAAVRRGDRAMAARIADVLVSCPALHQHLCAALDATVSPPPTWLAIRHRDPQLLQRLLHIPTMEARTFTFVHPATKRNVFHILFGAFTSQGAAGSGARMRFSEVMQIILSCSFVNNSANAEVLTLLATPDHTGVAPLELCSRLRCESTLLMCFRLVPAAAWAGLDNVAAIHRHWLCVGHRTAAAQLRAAAGPARACLPTRGAGCPFMALASSGHTHQRARLGLLQDLLTLEHDAIMPPRDPHRVVLAFAVSFPSGLEPLILRFAPVADAASALWQGGLDVLERPYCQRSLLRSLLCPPPKAPCAAHPMRRLVPFWWFLWRRGQEGVVAQILRAVLLVAEPRVAVHVALLTLQTMALCSLLNPCSNIAAAGDVLASCVAVLKAQAAAVPNAARSFIRQPGERTVDVQRYPMLLERPFDFSGHGAVGVEWERSLLSALGRVTAFVEVPPTSLLFLAACRDPSQPVAQCILRAVVPRFCERDAADCGPAVLANASASIPEIECFIQWHDALRAACSPRGPLVRSPAAIFSALPCFAQPPNKATLRRLSVAQVQRMTGEVLQGMTVPTWVQAATEAAVAADLHVWGGGVGRALARAWARLAGLCWAKGTQVDCITRVLGDSSRDYPGLFAAILGAAMGPVLPQPAQACLIEALTQTNGAEDTRNRSIVLTPRRRREGIHVACTARNAQLLRCCVQSSATSVGIDDVHEAFLGSLLWPEGQAVLSAMQPLRMPSSILHHAAPSLPIRAIRGDWASVGALAHWCGTAGGGGPWDQHASRAMCAGIESVPTLGTLRVLKSLASSIRDDNVLTDTLVDVATLHPFPEPLLLILSAEISTRLDTAGPRESLEAGGEAKLRRFAVGILSRPRLNLSLSVMALRIAAAPFWGLPSGALQQIWADLLAVVPSSRVRGSFKRHTAHVEM